MLFLTVARTLPRFLTSTHHLLASSCNFQVTLNSSHPPPATFSITFSPHTHFYPWPHQTPSSRPPFTTILIPLQLSLHPFFHFLNPFHLLSTSLHSAYSTRPSTSSTTPTTSPPFRPRSHYLPLSPPSATASDYCTVRVTTTVSTRQVGAALRYLSFTFTVAAYLYTNTGVQAWGFTGMVTSGKLTAINRLLVNAVLGMSSKPFRNSGSNQE